MNLKQNCCFLWWEGPGDDLVDYSGRNFKVSVRALSFSSPVCNMNLAQRDAGRIRWDRGRSTFKHEDQHLSEGLTDMRYCSPLAGCFPWTGIPVTELPSLNPHFRAALSADSLALENWSRETQPQQHTYELGKQRPQGTWRLGFSEMGTYHTPCSYERLWGCGVAYCRLHSTQWLMSGQECCPPTPPYVEAPSSFNRQIFAEL